jgi:hypothetical protein
MKLYAPAAPVAAYLQQHVFVFGFGLCQRHSHVLFHVCIGVVQAGGVAGNALEGDKECEEVKTSHSRYFAQATPRYSNNILKAHSGHLLHCALFSASLNAKFFGMKTFSLCLMLLAAPAAFSQKAANKLSFTKGQTLEVVTNMNISAESMMGPISGTVTSADSYSVNDASPASFTLVKVPKQIKMDISYGSQQMKLDSDNPDAMSPMLAGPVKDIMSRKPEFTIDATGKILSVKKDDAKKSDEEDASGMMGMMLPGMDFGSALPKAGSPSFFQVLPGREVAVGDTWTDSLADGDNKNVIAYKVKDITDNEIVLEFAGNGTTVTTREAMGTKIAVNATTKATGSIIIDKTTGIIKQKRSTNTTETAMNLGGQDVNSTVKTTLVTNVKSL